MIIILQVDVSRCLSDFEGFVPGKEKEDKPRGTIRHRISGDFKNHTWTSFFSVVISNLPKTIKLKKYVEEKCMLELHPFTNVASCKQRQKGCHSEIHAFSPLFSSSHQNLMPWTTTRNPAHQHISTCKLNVGLQSYSLSSARIYIQGPMPV